MRIADERVAVDDLSAAREDVTRAPAHGHAFEDVVVGLHVMRLRRDRARNGGIPHHDVRVAADRDRPLAREEAE